LKTYCPSCGVRLYKEEPSRPAGDFFDTLTLRGRAIFLLGLAVFIGLCIWLNPFARPKTPYDAYQGGWQVMRMEEDNIPRDADAMSARVEGNTLRISHRKGEPTWEFTLNVETDPVTLDSPKAKGIGELDKTVKGRWYILFNRDGPLQSTKVFNGRGERRKPGEVFMELAH